MSNRAYLSLGTNIEPEANMVAAVSLLAKRSRLVSISSVWETTAVGRADQPNYLNAAAIIETDLNAAQLREQMLRPIEAELGRVRQRDKFAPRPMDIDIMLFNDQVLDIDQRHIPDAEVVERAFVAIPLAEIAPNYIHPETGQTLEAIAAAFDAAQEAMRLRPQLSARLAKLIGS